MTLNITNKTEIQLSLSDQEWPFTYTDHDRLIARAIVTDESGNFYFVRAHRDDDFGKATLIETSGGGVEPGEPPEAAIRRELKEELGAEVEILCKIGTVSDYYNLIHRHNMNHYFLCKVCSFGEKHLMPDEISDFHLSTLKLSYEEAVAEYERCAKTPVGRLIMNREMPILRAARRILSREEKPRQFIHLFGAAGSGTTTLGKYIAEKLGFSFLDSDDYIWLPTDPPYTESRKREERIRLLFRDIDRTENAVLSGSIADWGNPLMPEFTLAIRMVTDQGVRLERIHDRELSRFGERILPGGDMYDSHREFLEWAAAYDDGAETIRSKRSHDIWQTKLTCPVLVLPGDASPEENFHRVLEVLEQNRTEQKD